MAFSYAVSGGTIFGNKRFKWGTFTNTGTSSGGDIVTGLTKVDNMTFAISSGITEFCPKITTLNTAGTTTIATSNLTCGYWQAFGL